MAYPQAVSFDAPGTKSLVVTWLLALFLGSLGIDRLYLGKVGTGILKLFTLWVALRRPVGRPTVRPQYSATTPAW